MTTTSQPTWKLVANLGDVNPIDHGGYFVYVDEAGKYGPEAEWLEPPCEDGPDTWEVYRFTLGKCTYVDGVLSDNPYHPSSPAWWADDLDSIVDCRDDKDGIIMLLISDNPLDRAVAYRDIGRYYGFVNLDAYPLELNREEVEARYPE